MGYDDSTQANCAKALAKFAQDYGYDRFTWRGTIKSPDQQAEQFAVEVRLSAGDIDSGGKASAGDLANKLASYRSNSEFGPVHHIICDEAAALIWKLIAENRQLVADHAKRGNLLAREAESATEVRSSTKATGLFESTNCNDCGGESDDVARSAPLAPAIGARVRILERPRVGSDRFRNRERTIVRTHFAGFYVKLDMTSRERTQKTELVETRYLEVLPPPVPAERP